MSMITHPYRLTSPVPLRWLCAMTGAIVVIDALAVRAPGLALLALPFLVAAAAMRRGSTIPMVGLTAASVLFVVVGVNFALSNGFDAGWGDLLFTYAGTPAALGVGILAGLRLSGRWDHSRAGVGASRSNMS